MKMKQHLQDRFVICFQSNLFMALKLCNKKIVKHWTKRRRRYWSGKKWNLWFISRSLLFLLRKKFPYRAKGKQEKSFSMNNKIIKIKNFSFSNKKFTIKICLCSSPRKIEQHNKKKDKKSLLYIFYCCCILKGNLFRKQISWGITFGRALKKKCIMIHFFFPL